MESAITQTPTLFPSLIAAIDELDPSLKSKSISNSSEETIQVSCGTRRDQLESFAMINFDFKMILQTIIQQLIKFCGEIVTYFVWLWCLMTDCVL